MIKQFVRPFLLVGLGLLSGNSFAANYESLQQQDTTKIPNDWFLRDPETEHFQGVSAEKTYATILKDKPSKTVLVAVIDSGIDTNHEDLKDVIWVNEDEIAGNGVDDDKNGYIDDVHGWNFIGGKNGNVSDDTYELTREYARLKSKFANTTDQTVGKKDKTEFEQWKKIKQDFEEKSVDATKKYEFYKGIYESIAGGNDTLKKILGVKKITLPLLDSVKAETPEIKIAKGSVAWIFEKAGPDADVEAVLEELEGAVEHFETQAKYGYNLDFNPRTIVGDDYNNVKEKNYGNNDVAGPDPTHGTHVAGIIGANRNNTIGIKGIANNVRIMSVRAVPNGDERDKDVANAILYAVDNGAKIINMSFGKAYSPQKDVVDKAVKYAESKGVLLIHAAGNDAENNDVDDNFPNRTFKNGKDATNWLEIGASAWGADDEFVAPFSNYGKKSVDFFAPGVEIYSTMPGSKYKNQSGTSMACPASSGVAAILMSYFPELSVSQVKDILKKSTRKFDGLKVNKPGAENGEQIEFSTLSNTGGLVNAYEAVKLAMTMTKKAEK